MKNGKPNDLESRLQLLEAEMKEIKAMLFAQQEQQQPQGWQSVVGAFAGDPVFAEITRLGAEIREKEREKARRTKKKKQNA